MSPNRQSWTLFLDRDGVINKRLPNDYVKSIEAFDLKPGVLDALNTLSDIFSKICIVTNQQGIGKGLMTTGDLGKIHDYFRKKASEAGARIDGMYFGEELANYKPYHRKPQPGMALMAKSDFPSIEFHRSIMLGDSTSDIEFGQNLGMKTVLIATQTESIELEANPDYITEDLHAFSSGPAQRIIDSH